MVKKQMVKNKKQVVVVGGGNVFDESAPKKSYFCQGRGTESFCTAVNLGQGRQTVGVAPSDADGG